MFTLKVKEILFLGFYFYIVHCKVHNNFDPITSAYSLPEKFYGRRGIVFYSLLVGKKHINHFIQWKRGVNLTKAY